MHNRKGVFRLSLVAALAAMVPADRVDAQSTSFEADRLRFDVPSAFCAVDPGRGGHQADLWRHFTPRPERGVRMLALGIDCATLALGRLQRPRALLNLVEARHDPSLPSGQEDALKALELRFSRPELAAKAPVLGRDDLAVYVAQRIGDGPAGGISAYTITTSGRALIFSIIHFDAPPALATLRAEAERTVRDLNR